ncbi:uncharacterized protein AB675_3756 [Cyphellophora attinorum]|uniref:CHRD domain-containing protein n=1 Tax=Cyphellophora attinorum TaxID=1664694 RepID=A0A0N1NXN3_9EURO|nr:uncharacterized protein AB675_3756 [Phialophora attinorum]KPI35254.1 hypothetical protein AB675_3756 [Phialophora attinorum]
MKVTATIAGLVALTSVASAFPFGGGSGGKGDKEWKDFKDYPKGFPFKFTSIYQVTATPDQVVNANNTVTPGEPGAVGYYNYGINSELDLICWYITLKGVTGPYQSPARTATHIHQAVKGRIGPPRIALTNPEPANSTASVDKISVGCQRGPFTTGILANGTDTGTGFMVKQIEENPSGFFTDAHTVSYPAGVVRGQLA